MSCWSSPSESRLSTRIFCKNRRDRSLPLFAGFFFLGGGWRSRLRRHPQHQNKNSHVVVTTRVVVLLTDTCSQLNKHFTAQILLVRFNWKVKRRGCKLQDDDKGRSLILPLLFKDVYSLSIFLLLTSHPPPPRALASFAFLRWKNERLWTV